MFSWTLARPQGWHGTTLRRLGPTSLNKTTLEVGLSFQLSPTLARQWQQYCEADFDPDVLEECLAHLRGEPEVLITMTLHQNCTLKIVAYFPDCPSRTGVYPLVAAHCREHCAQQAPGQALDPTLRSWADQGPRLEGVVVGSPSTWSAAGS